MKYLATLLVALSLCSSHLWAQLPNGATATWDTIMQPKQHVSPTFKESANDNTKTNLQQAKLTVNFGNGKKYKVTKATLIVKVSGGQGVWNPAVKEDAAIVSGGMNKWELTGADFTKPKLVDFDPTKDVRIEYDIDFVEVLDPPPPGQQAPPAPPTLKSTVGSKDIKPTVP
jgi:hypothetical protein